MRNRKRYLHIKNMEQLKTERARLESDIVMKEELYSIHYSKFRDSIRISSLISTAITRVSVMVPLIVKTTKTFRNLFDFIFAQFKSEKQEPDLQEIELEDNNNSSLKNEDQA